MLAATAPDWLSSNLVLITVGFLVVATLLLFRFVRRTGARLLCLGVIVGLAVLVYANRVPLEECADTCECSLGGRDVSVPFCDPVELTAPPPARAPA